VTASAVVEFVGSAFVLLMAALMALAAVAGPPQLSADVADQGPYATLAGLKPMMLVMTSVLAGLAALGGWTGFGLWRMRPWARVSTLVFAGVMTAMSAFSVAMMLLIPSVATSTGQSVAPLDAMRPFLVVFYGIPLAIGVWWLFYFNRASTRAAFAAPDVPGAPDAAPSRPLSISIVGWMSVVGGAVMLANVLGGLPAFVGGLVLTGWPARFANLAMAAIAIALGWSVLKLNETGRRLMIAWHVLIVGHALYVTLLPGMGDRMAAAQRAMRLPQPTGPTADAMRQPAMVAVLVAFSAVFAAVVIWFLVRERAHFGPRRGLMPPASPA
jgi:hypothetical protein